MARVDPPPRRRHARRDRPRPAGDRLGESERVHAHRRVAAVAVQPAAADPAGEGDVLGEAGAYVGMRVAAGPVVGLPGDGQHRSEGDVGRDARSGNCEAAAAHERHDVGEHDRLLAWPHGVVPRLHRDDRLVIVSDGGGDVVEEVRSGLHVGVDEDEDGAVRSAGADPASVRLSDPHRRQVGCPDHGRAVGPRDRSRVVGRLVVDDDELVGGPELRHERSEEVREGVRLVAGRHDHRHRRSLARRRRQPPGGPQQQPADRPPGEIQPPAHLSIVAEPGLRFRVSNVSVGTPVDDEHQTLGSLL